MIGGWCWMIMDSLDDAGFRLRGSAAASKTSPFDGPKGPLHQKCWDFCMVPYVSILTSESWPRCENFVPKTLGQATSCFQFSQTAGIPCLHFMHMPPAFGVLCATVKAWYMWYCHSTMGIQTSRAYSKITTNLYENGFMNVPRRKTFTATLRGPTFSPQPPTSVNSVTKSCSLGLQPCYVLMSVIPVVPHKAVAEVSKIGNL